MIHKAPGCKEALKSGPESDHEKLAWSLITLARKIQAAEERKKQLIDLYASGHLAEAAHVDANVSLDKELAWSDDDLAYMRHGNSSFLLQNFYNEVHAGNFMMHLLVTDVDAWWHYVQAQGIASKYDTKTEPPEDRPWGIRDFVLVDPTGVLWRT